MKPVILSRRQGRTVPQRGTKGQYFQIQLLIKSVQFTQANLKCIFPHFSGSPMYCSEAKSAAWGFLRKSTECVRCFQERSQISALPPQDILSFSKFSHWEIMTLKSNVTKSCIVSKLFKRLTSTNYCSVSFSWNDVLCSHKLPQLAAPLIKWEHFQSHRCSSKDWESNRRGQHIRFSAL